LPSTFEGEKKKKETRRNGSYVFRTGLKEIIRVYV